MAVVSAVGVGDNSTARTAVVGFVAAAVVDGIGVGVKVGAGVWIGCTVDPGFDVAGFGVAAGLAVGFGVAGLGVVVGFGVAGFGVAGFGLAGGSIPGGDAAPGEPSSENDHPSTLPGGGVRVRAPSLLVAQVPPRAACQYDQ
jgi:hypothetical protein